MKLNVGEKMEDKKDQYNLRYLIPHFHLGATFGNDWFALKAEAFARFFGTSFFLIFQTIIVTVWILLNVFGILHFDLYPFILLNLAFSLQAAYAAPLILLAQTRQADRDKAHSEADAEHREEISNLNLKQQEEILVLLAQNTSLTKSIKIISEQISKLSEEVHKKIINGE